MIILKKYNKVNIDKDNIVKIISSNPNIDRSDSFCFDEISYSYKVFGMAKIPAYYKEDILFVKKTTIDDGTKKVYTVVILNDLYYCLYEKEFFDTLKKMENVSKIDQKTVDNVINKLLGECV